MINFEDQSQFIKQMTDFQQTALDSSIKTMEINQTRMENMINVLMNHSQWTMEKWQGAISDWTKMYEQGCESFKQAAENNFSKMGKFMNKD